MFRIKVFNNNGEIVVNSTIDSLTTTESSNSLENIKNQLNKLIEYTFNIGDTISIWTSNHEKVKIKGNIENKTHDYSNGLIAEMEKVRFKITEDGLQEIKASTPVITFEENENTSVEVKRGEAIEYLNGVTITDTNEHIELSKVKYTSKKYRH